MRQEERRSRMYARCFAIINQPCLQIRNLAEIAGDWDVTYQHMDRLEATFASNKLEMARKRAELRSTIDKARQMILTNTEALGNFEAFKNSLNDDEEEEQTALLQRTDNNGKDEDGRPLL